MSAAPRRRALVTGGAGFLGSHICTALLDRDYEVVCADDYCTGTTDNIRQLLDRPGFRTLRADVAREFDVPGPLDLIVHLASPASPPDYLRLPLHTLETGSRGTSNVLDLARRHGARFVLSSTSEVYGDPVEHPQTEGYWGNVNPVGPRSVYDEAKRFSEALTMAEHSAHGVDIAIARLFNTYGPRMRPHDGRAVPTFIRQALAGEPLTVAGDGGQTRCLTYVDDTVAGILALAGSTVTGPVNIGDDTEASVLAIAELVIVLTGSASPVTFVPRPAAARNVGWRAADTEWTAFLDDDTVPGPTWARDLAADLARADPQTAGVQGRIIIPLPFGRPPTDWERGTAGLADAPWITADMAFRRTALEEVHGFDERFRRAYREDSDLALRVLEAGWGLEQGLRVTVHPVRPAGPGAPVRAQAGNADDVLMRRLHGRDWRRACGAPPGRLRVHLAVTTAALGSAACLALRAKCPAAVLAALWAAGVGEFAGSRIRRGPRDRREVATMAVTSALIPAAATAHRLRGGWAHRDAEPWPTGESKPRIGRNDQESGLKRLSRVTHAGMDKADGSTRTPAEPPAGHARHDGGGPWVFLREAGERPADAPLTAGLPTPSLPSPGTPTPGLPTPGLRPAGLPTAVLFDRDGTLVEDVPYNGDPDAVRLRPGAAEAVRALRKRGVAVGVVTNQSGVARGKLTRDQVEAVNRRVDELVGPLDVWAVCPHGPDAACRCRKPAPGLVVAAACALGLDPATVVVIGDIEADLRAAEGAGAKGILVPNSATLPRESARARYRAADLLAATSLLTPR